MGKGGVTFGLPRTLAARENAIAGTFPMDHRWRHFLLSLARHKAKTASGYAYYQASGLDEWQLISRGRGYERKVNQSTGNISERCILSDPSNECSWEEIARPSLRSQAIEDDAEQGGYGCGNVRFVTNDKYVTLLGAEVSLNGKAYTPDRGSVSNPWSVKIKVVNMESNIIRGDTPAESKVEEVFSLRVEQDHILLHGWNVGMPPSIAPLEKLDEWHLLWYRIVTTGTILCGYEHHGASEFDKKIMENHLTKLHSKILDRVADMTLPPMSGEVFGRLGILSAMQPTIMRHVVELRRMVKFANSEPIPSLLGPVAAHWQRVRAVYVPPAPVQQPKRKKAKQHTTEDQRRAAQEERDYKMAIQLSKQLGYDSTISYATTTRDRDRRGQARGRVESS